VLRAGAGAFPRQDGPHDAVAWIVAAVLMIGVTLLAAAIPAIRATGRDPMDILRAE
jgi:ABC-type antimicrobial peptide transport system permease subunit